MIELEGLLVASLGVPSAAQRLTPSENVKYGSWRRKVLEPHIPVFIKRLRFPGKAVTKCDQEWDAWRQRNLKTLKDRILDISGLGVTCTLHSYGYRLEEDPCTVVRRTYRGNILQYTLGPPELDEAGKISVLLDVARALEHLHSQSPPIVHGGIHPTEILIDDQGHAVLLDFGMGHIVARLESPPACAPSMRYIPWGGYYAPEIIEQLPPTPAMDVFAFAGVMLVVMSGLHPHSDFPFPEAAHIMKGNPSRSSHPRLPSEHQLWQTMEEMWDTDVKNRPAMPLIVQTLDNLLATHTHNTAPLPEIHTSTPSSTTEISNPLLEELVKMALNTLKLERRPSGYPVLLSQLLSRLDKEHSPEFDSGELEPLINPNIARGAFSQITQYNWRQVLPGGTPSVIAVAVKTLKIEDISDWSDAQKQNLLNKATSPATI
ncbi:hypothetical protein FRC04_004841 [Tulasnella sp. 424]|nr:hypothetical protein FRC04_004841 [Tulasnella sp. 424]